MRLKKHITPERIAIALVVLAPLVASVGYFLIPKDDDYDGLLSYGVHWFWNAMLPIFQSL